MELEPYQQNELLALLRNLEPTLEYAPEESWSNKECATDFVDSCGCYSEYTTDSCRLYVFVKGKLPNDKDKQWKLTSALNDVAEAWAGRTLSWSGCSSCGDELYVSVHLFQAE